MLNIRWECMSVDMRIDMHLHNDKKKERKRLSVLWCVTVGVGKQADDIHHSVANLCLDKWALYSNERWSDDQITAAWPENYFSLHNELYNHVSTPEMDPACFVCKSKLGRNPRLNQVIYKPSGSTWSSWSGHAGESYDEAVLKGFNAKLWSHAGLFLEKMQKSIFLIKRCDKFRIPSEPLLMVLWRVETATAYILYKAFPVLPTG